MAKQMPIDLFVKELEAALNRGDGYIMGSYGQNPRTGHLSLARTDALNSWKEDGWFYSQYSGKQRRQALKWRENCTRVWDCNGMAEGIYEMYTGTCINTRARNNYQSWCSIRGTGLIPVNRRVPGAAVFWGGTASDIHHVAYLWKPVYANHPEGDWYLIEARGVMYGVVSTKLLSRSPNFWGYMDKYFDYSKYVSPEPESKHTMIIDGSRVLKSGCRGGDIMELQSMLIQFGYSVGASGADGIFGKNTEKAVRQFQADHGLVVDGKFGPKSLAAMQKAITAAEGVNE